MISCLNKECKQTNPQPDENFPLEKEGAYTWRRKTCKACRCDRLRAFRHKKREEYNAYMRQYRVEHKDSKKWKDWYRNRHLKKKYGITLERYAEILASQGGRCFLCPKTFSGKSKKLNVDHAHKSGKVRGLLCDGCNRTIAILDNPELFARALAYIAQ